MVWGNARKFRLARIGQAAAKVVAWKMCQCTLNPCHLTAKSRGICAFLKSIASNTPAKPSIAPFRGQEDPLVSSIMKATKQALGAWLEVQGSIADSENSFQFLQMEASQHPTYNASGSGGYDFAGHGEEREAELR